MGVDKTTELKWFNFLVEDNKDYLKDLREHSESQGMNEGCDNSWLSIEVDNHSCRIEEYYFDETTDSIHISAELLSSKGKSSIYLDIPLSDIVLIDILQYALKRFSKLKTALETLK